ncbi:hypothetical protein BOO92_15810 [Vibrio navarrensis]|uniref:hypothetical protein n=1 Tax=Vibrio navarrensis TaxID=29495 RepID=UPI00186892BB|nr:hypothetical protein [Vibrio navarrensis]EHA1127162.1 hypothetical protein [Vibrio navarrensis]MBE3658145.1 hypothetical protein [Vibrio navarrensis]MBH9739887.1 hypothetical protein [Vibrio navarrensis]HDY8122819.1 hypothetical protein [Vibrio vulnificus]
MTEYMAVGRIAMGENEVIFIETDSHEKAAKKAAISILNCQHESWNDDIYIDLVVDKNFRIECDFVFEVDELRSNNTGSSTSD